MEKIKNVVWKQKWNPVFNITLQDQKMVDWMKYDVITNICYVNIVWMQLSYLDFDPVCLADTSEVVTCYLAEHSLR